MMVAYFPWFLFDWDDPMNPTSKSNLRDEPALIKVKKSLQYGSPEALDLAVRLRSNRLGAPVAASPSRTAKASPAASERVGGRPSSAHGS